MSGAVPFGKERSDYVKGKFSLIAKRYNLFNDLITLGMHRYWKGFLVERMRAEEGSRVLDICCGTGDICRRLRAKVGSRGLCVGLDFSDGMLKVAASRKGTAGVSFVKADATKLPFRDGSFDAVGVGYGLRNLADLDQGLREVRRVLKPGGRFLSLDVGKVRLPVVGRLFHLYFFFMVPAIGKTICPGEDLFDYFPRSTVDYPSQEELSDKLTAAGFERVGFFPFLFGGSVVHCSRKPQEDQNADRTGSQAPRR